MTFWDQAYDTPQYKYGTAPNAFVRAQSALLAPGSRVLVPGDGEGRNGVWLAVQGHEVLSVDSSSVGLAKARALAQKSGVPLATEQADLAEWTPAPASFDAVVLTYVHLPPAIRTRVHRRLAGALRPGGWLILEAFTRKQLAYGSGGPKDGGMLYSLDALCEDFSGLLREERASEGVLKLDEGPGHQGPAHVLRWLGQKPALGELS